LEALTPEEKTQYLEMVGADGWCIHYDTGARRCRIYNERPNFCRVDQLAQRFGVEAQQHDAFAIACCRQQIRVEYGGRSLEMRRFERAIQNNTSDSGHRSGQ
jgi:Fe-S-cluster containining protein